MIRSTLLTLAVATAFAPAALAQIPFTFGNVVVTRVGDGSSALSSVGAPIFLDEYTPTGVFVRTVPLPTATVGANRRIVVRGTGVSEGFLNLSSNGLSLLVAGYDAGVGDNSATANGGFRENALINPRVIAVIDLLGNVDTTTAVTDAYSGGDMRSVASDNGQRFWLAGSTGGTRFVANLGDSASLLLNAGAPQNMRVVNIYDSDVYVSTASIGASTLGPVKLGSGLVTTPGQLQTLLPGFPTGPSTAAGSPYDFWFADPNTVYVCDDNSVASTVGGIQKWTFDANTQLWTVAYRLQLGGVGANSGARAISGFTQNGVTTLWAIVNPAGTGSSPTELVTVTDTGPNSVVTSLAVSPPNTAFRGVRYFGLPTTAQRISGLSCSTADIKVDGNGQIGTRLRTTVVNPTGVATAINYGFTLFNLPLCTCTVLSDSVILVPGESSTLTIPNVPAIIGARLYVQGVNALDPAANCASLPFATVTDGFEITAQ